MKANKKVILSTAAVLGITALSLGGTIAYFTDKKEVENKFVVGDVKIELYESQLHRQNAGRTGSFAALPSDPDYCDYTHVQTGDGINYNNNPMNTYTSARYCTPLADANNTDNLSAVENGHTRIGFSNANRDWGYADALIKLEAATYEEGYFARNAKNVVPGQWIRKFAYVENQDNSSDAYVLIRYLVPADIADKIEVKIPGTPYEEDTDATKDGVQGYFTALNRDAQDKFVAYDSSAKDSMDNYIPYEETIHDDETDEDITYKVYAAVTTQALEPGEMTFWSPVNTIRLKDNTQNTDITDTETYVAPGALYNIKVDAQAIQAKTFSNAIEAINKL